MMPMPLTNNEKPAMPPNASFITRGVGFVRDASYLQQ